ncbi:substrate-binding domain-containing protein [Pantoea sp. Mb-10]|uniref:substrate-binding domain-containing protein n=1 Tax=unclassified Pantoea TaxID=2630326 RepID=UPI001E49E0E0|nr:MULTISPECIES: substrate-binding domain-containing protein [unclassified Pantoea]MCE0491880.1 substrate-binding domain-containing protein [Pantoea sp. Mb-10]MCE0503382.1 substrate-binding domain-containing protein [Pantoea sp. Pb-8]
MRKFSSSLLATLVLASLSGTAAADDVTVMISGGFKAALEKLAPDYEKASGHHLVIVPGPSMGKTPQAIPNRLARGEKADVVIMVGDALSDLEHAKRTLTGSRVELADSPIGVVVKKGASVPDIKTDAALRATLLQAPSVAYSDSASGRYVSTTLFKKLGIDNQMQTKARMVERIPVASEVAKGTYALGLQQVSELLPVSGVTFVGELPDNVQYITRFAGAVTANAAHPQAGKALLTFLASPQAQKVVTATGMHSVKASATAKPTDTVQ